MQKDKKTEEGFVSRWNRRKNEGPQERETAVAEPDIEAANSLDTDAAENSEMPMVAAQQQPTADAPEEEPVLTDADMPPLESLNSDSDFSMFMSPGVSEALRKLALRKLFGRASFNVRDGLDDYDDDFRNFAALGDIITCDMQHQIELEEERKREEEAAKAEAQADEDDNGPHEEDAEDNGDEDSDDELEEDQELADPDAIRADAADEESDAPRDEPKPTKGVQTQEEQKNE